MQQTVSETKTVRVDARLTESQKSLFLQAASLAGYKTLSDFIITTVQERATALVREHEAWELSQRDQEIFMDALLNPPPPSPKLRKATKKYVTRAV